MADEEQRQEEPVEGGAQSEEELRAQLEEEIRKAKVGDLILQSTVSILNLAARRIAKDDERDLAQGKQGIDAAEALLDLVPEEAQPQLRQAVSELQLLYAKHAGEGAEEPEGGGEPGAGGSSGSGTAEGEPEPPPRRDSGLWTPPGT